MRYLALILSALYLHFVDAQETLYQGLTVVPTTLKAGANFAIKVDASPYKMASSDVIHAIITEYSKGQHSISSSQMVYKDGIFTAAATLQPNTDVLTIKLLQDKNLIDNYGQGFIFKVLDPSGKENNNTYYTLYRILQGDYIAGVTSPNHVLANENFELWAKKSNIPSAPTIDKMAYYYQKKDSTAICNTIVEIGNAVLSQKDFDNITYWIRNCGPEQKKIVLDKYKSAFPHGSWYTKMWLDSLKTKGTLAEKLSLLEAYKKSRNLSDNQYDKTFDDLLGQTGNAAYRVFDVQTLQKLNNLAAGNTKYVRTMWSHNRSLASTCLAKDTLMAVVPSLIKQCESDVSCMKKDKSLKFDYYSIPQLQVDIQRLDQINKSIKAEYLSKTGDDDKAFGLMREVADFYDWTSLKFNKMLYDLAVKLNHKDFLSLSGQIFKGGGFDLDMIKSYQNKYYQLTGKDAKEQLDLYKKFRVEKLISDYRLKMLDIPTDDFEISTADGVKITKGDLKGKVVFMDFWATWCRPCIASFPAMQKFSDENKKNPSYRTYFVNTLEGKPDRVETVKKFLDKNPYTFDVVFDLKDKVSKSFNITGLPSKIILDKNGVIRFISVGTGDNELKAVEELQAMMKVAEEIPMENGKVSIQGKLIHFQNLEQVEDYSEFQYLTKTPDERLIHADSSGHFSITFPLTDPNYFRIGRNTIYLSPGDDLKVVLNRDDCTKSTFEGRGSEANNYLKYVAFPKGGSYVNAGRIISNDISSTLFDISKNVNEQKERLDKLSNVTDEFKRLEMARLKADIYNTFSSMRYYINRLSNVMSKDSFELYRSKIFAMGDMLLPHLVDIDPSLLKLVTYRSNIKQYLETKTDIPEKDKNLINDWMVASKLSDKLNGNINDSELNAIKKNMRFHRTP